MSSRLEELPDSWVAVSTTAAFQFMVRQPVEGGVWLALKRPLFIAFVLACDISLITGDPFDPRLVASATFYWAFVPLSEALALLLVCANARAHAPLSRVLDLYFTGHAPWLLWFTAVGVAWSLQSPQYATAFMFTHIGILAGGSLVALIWSCCIDFYFFEVVLGRSRIGAVGSLIVQRTISWLLILLIFSWASLSAEWAPRLAS